MYVYISACAELCSRNLQTSLAPFESQEPA